ncbi:hypothetical protein BB560_004929 [Smittium megazygosporum]|uniref:AP complex subunit sigma n=1 Tax=Smittium megazygosporum TaxID=133381 RepID=A0A2T9Z820_9FUNG|nr:hypothetical protein BB560_004929 [Smittium megazygosporum]
MIQFILVQNKQGKTRIEKWFAQHEDSEKEEIKAKVHSLVLYRNQSYYTNFIEFGEFRIVYRRYAGLYFCFCVDSGDNILSYLESIHLFVEVLDTIFQNVTELDLVFSFLKVYSIVDEMFLAGEIEETSKEDIIKRIALLDSLG